MSTKQAIKRANVLVEKAQTELFNAIIAQAKKTVARHSIVREMVDICPTCGDKIWLCKKHEPLLQSIRALRCRSHTTKKPNEPEVNG